MPPPTIEVLGVDSLSVTKDLLREQTDILYGSDPTKSDPLVRRSSHARAHDQAV